jgi:hypothetical protein
MEIKNLTNAQLENMIANYRRLEQTNSPTFRALLEEHNSRFGNGLEIGKTVQFIRQRAARRRFLSYGEIAELHGVDWSSVRYQMPSHLWDVIRWGRSMGFPLLSAVIVNKKHLDTGRMEPDTLKGFVNAARELGYTVTEPLRFLAEQQEKCFDWASQKAESMEEAT